MRKGPIHRGAKVLKAPVESNSAALRRGAALLVCALCAVLLAADDGDTQEDDPQTPLSTAFWIRVPLPIAGETDTQIKRTVDRLIERMPPNASVRPTIVFEFQGDADQLGQTSEFERALSLARYLTSQRLSHIRTVAYLPRGLKGHAVLAALACDQIVMSSEADLGEAGIDEQFIDPAMRNSYRDIAGMRRLIDANVVQGMLDRNLEVFRVTTINDEVRYVLADEFQRIEMQGMIKTSDVVIAEGEFGRLSGYELRHTFQFVSHLADTREEVAQALGIPRSAILEDPSWAETLKPILIDLQGPIDARTVSWTLSSLHDEIGSGQANLIILRIDSRGGSPTHSLNLANHLAGLDSSKVRSIAYVANEAKGDAALVALACDQLVMSPEATLGGPGDFVIPDNEMSDMRKTLAEIAALKSRDWSLRAALVDPQLVVRRYARDGPFEPRYFCQEELDAREDAQRWRPGAEIETREGVSGGRAEQLGLARALASSWEEFLRQSAIDQEPRQLEPNWGHSAVELFAEKLSSRWLARTLLFIAFIALLSEASAPGLGVPGFVSALCFLLFFWSQFTQGNANILEISLFLLGLVSIGLEVFVIPGFGVFGIGGMVLVVVSIILASQTFVVPRTSAQLHELVYSLSMVLSAGAGVFVGLVVLRRVLPNAPIFNRMMLQPPQGDHLEQLSQRESLADRTHLAGKRGVTTTRLNPSGKAQFGDETVDVVSDGSLIDQGSEICVVDVSGNHVVVRALEEVAGGG